MDKKEYYLNNRQKLLDYGKEYYLKNRRKYLEYKRDKYYNDDSFRQKQLNNRKQLFELIWKKTVNHYGGKCACCGFNDLKKKVRQCHFLQFDHINGQGNKHRKDEKYAHLFYWLYKNNFPGEFRLLCASCNVAMEPHEVICEYHKWEGRRKP